MRYRSGLRLLLTVMVMVLLSAAQASAMSLSDTLLQRELRQWRQDKWCEGQGGQARAVLADGTRVDCLTRTAVIKAGAAAEWQETLGEALCYGWRTGKKPGVVLVLENADDQQYWHDLRATIEHFGLPVATWKIGP